MAEITAVTVPFTIKVLRTLRNTGIRPLNFYSLLDGENKIGIDYKMLLNEENPSTFLLKGFF